MQCFESAESLYNRNFTHQYRVFNVTNQLEEEKTSEKIEQT